MRPWPLLVLALAAAAPARAARGEAFAFLRRDTSARAAALGGAYSTLATDAQALSYNAAGLSRLESHELALMHDADVQDLSQDHLALALRPGFALELNTLSLGGIPRATLASPDGDGEVPYRDLALAAGAGVKLGASLGAGLAVRHLRETLDDVRASGLAADAGLLLRPAAAPGLALGLAARNWGPPVRFQREREPLPSTVRAGASYQRAVGPARLLASFDAERGRSGGLDVSAGIEAAFVRELSLRAGFTSAADEGLGVAGGLGLRVGGWRFDYAFVPLGELGAAHRLGLTLSWGAPAASKRKPASQRKAARRPARNPYWPTPD